MTQDESSRTRMESYRVMHPTAKTSLSWVAGLTATALYLAVLAPASASASASASATAVGLGAGSDDNYNEDVGDGKLRGSPSAQLSLGPTTTSKPAEICVFPNWCTSDKVEWETVKPIVIGIGVFLSILTASAFIWNSLIRRMPNYRSADGDTADTDSVNSMQRWINERLRDRPPRYEEMVSESSSSPASTATMSTADNPEAEKPPSYETVVSETQRSDVVPERVVDNGPPPLYTSIAFTLMGDDEQGFSNPCFVGDSFDRGFDRGFDPPPYSQTASPESYFNPNSSLVSSSSFHSCSSSSPSSSSLSSVSSITLSSSSDAAPANLLTVSQAVAISEMVLSEH